MRCQGITYSLTLLPPSVVPPEDEGAHPQPIVGEMPVVSDRLAGQVVGIPETPPPELRA